MKRIVSIASMLLFAAAAWAEVDLEWRLENEQVRVGDTVRIGLYAVADPPEAFVTADVLLEWDADLLELQGFVDGEWDLPWMDICPFWRVEAYSDINETWDDGDAWWTAWVELFNVAWATPEGALMSVFGFEATTPGVATLGILPEITGCINCGEENEWWWVVPTTIYSAEIPGLNIVGELGTIEFPILPDISPAKDHSKLIPVE